jgi:uncharacterized RDD family membrane protein YckC
VDTLAVVSELISFGVTLLLSLAVSAYYRSSVFSPDEKYSTFGPRFWTAPVDSCVLWPLSFAISYLLALRSPPIVTIVLMLVGNLSLLVYPVIMHGRYGQTVGKMVTKVRVVDFRTECAISWRQAWLREGIPVALGLAIVVYQAAAVWKIHGPAIRMGAPRISEAPLFWLLGMLPALWFLAEVITMLTNEKRRALHDLIAGTVVIRTNVRQPDQPTAPETVVD